MSEELKKIWEEHKAEIVLLSVVGAIFLSGYMLGYRQGYKQGISNWTRHLSVKWFSNAEGVVDHISVNGKMYKLIAGAIPTFPLA